MEDQNLLHDQLQGDEEMAEPVWVESLFQRLKRAVVNRILAATWWLGRLFFYLSATVISVVIVYRWFVWSIRCILAMMWDHAQNLWYVIDRLSPSSSEHLRERKHQLVRERIVQVVEETMSGYYEFMPWRWLAWYEMVVLVSIGILVKFSIYCSLRYAWRSSRRIVQRARGVQTESVRSGSTFKVGKMPTCQVSVSRPGLLSDTHLGYGVRKGSYLVMPEHVLTYGNEQLSEVVLEGTKGKVLTSLIVEKSLIVDDLIYCHLNEQTWSLLGTSKPKWSREVTGQYVEVYGKPGVTSGRIQKTSVRWQIAYSGSTVPGMSGSAYMAGGQVWGIHIGSAASYNVGWCSVLIGAEVAKMARLESPNDNEDNRPSIRFKNSENIWDQTKALDALERKYSKDPWTAKAPLEDDDDEFYNQKLDFGTEGATPPSFTIPTEIKLTSLKRQGGDGKSGVQVTVSEDDLDYLNTLRSMRVEKHIVDLMQRVDRLEGRGPPIQPRARREVSAPPEVKAETVIVDKPERAVEKIKIKCSVCGNPARSEEKLRNHMENSHGTVRESAIPSDTGVTSKQVKQGHFLGTRRVSPRNSGKNSTNILNSLNNNNRSQHQGGSLSDLMDSQRNIEKCLKELLQVMVGRSSDSGPN